jgi:hypothetical protein
MPETDPFRVVLGLIGNDSDVLVEVANTTGLQFDLQLTEREGGAHKTRVRALLPRIVNAYGLLGGQEKLAVARAGARAFCRLLPGSAARLDQALGAVGWELRDGDLVVGAPDIREMFFPKDSPWDAYVVLRAVFAEARASLTILDAYCDHTVFGMLASREVAGLGVRILCSRHATAVAAEATRFMAQHPGVTIEVRETRDFHDRFIVVDGTACIHVGASIKDAGKTAFMISRVEDRENRDAILTALERTWTSAPPAA